MGRKGQWCDLEARTCETIPPFEKNKLENALSTVFGRSSRQIPVSEDGADLKAVYRYFDNAKYADDFANGLIYISTLDACRRHEDPLRGDPNEGHESFSTGSPITGDGDDPEFVEMCARAGIIMGPAARGNSISIGLATRVLEDAYVLCTTIGFDSNSLENSFGRYCVKIESIEIFFHLISKSLYEKVGDLQAMKGPIIYKERHSVGMMPAAGPIGFVKPPDKYADQREYRFLWVKKRAGAVEPIVIHCPEAAALLTRIK